MLDNRAHRLQEQSKKEHAKRLGKWTGHPDTDAESNTREIKVAANVGLDAALWMWRQKPVDPRTQFIWSPRERIMVHFHRASIQNSIRTNGSAGWRNITWRIAKIGGGRSRIDTWL
jgi:hypothetical protein